MTTTTNAPEARERPSLARTDLPATLAELQATEAAYPDADADVLTKLALVEMGFRGAHGPHDQTALDSARAAVARMVLPGATASCCATTAGCTTPFYAGWRSKPTPKCCGSKRAGNGIVLGSRV